MIKNEKQNLKFMKNFFYAATIIAFSQLLFAQDDNENKVEEGLPLKATRAIDINTNEGTWISLDVHPSGEKIILIFWVIYTNFL